jgi:hypothetical protein
VAGIAFFEIQERGGYELDNKMSIVRSGDTIKERMKQLESYFINKRLRKYNVKIAFAISLKSKSVSRNWAKVQSNLAKTLRSILRNTDPNFCIVIAGHEKPTIKEMQHRRVKWLTVNFRPPLGTLGFSSDKLRKRKVIGMYLRKIGFSGYFMPLDADDWVHYRLVEYVRSQPARVALIMNSGVIVNLVRNEVWLRKHRFYIGCGSSTIFYFSNKEFPLSLKNSGSLKESYHMVLRGHTKVFRNLREINKPYKLVKFPLITWVLGHGDNNSMLKGKKSNSISAKDYGSKGERLQQGFYAYFKS